MILFYVTCSNLSEAKRIGMQLIEEKVAGCVNIWMNEASIYSWEGKMVEEKEAILLIKSIAEKKEKLKSRIAELHSYSIPCILELKVDSVNSSYQKWLESAMK